MQQPRVSLPTMTAPVRRHEVVHGDGALTAEDLVTCKERRGSVPLTTCLECDELAGFDGTVIRCRPRITTPDASPRPRQRGCADFREAALRVSSGELMETRCASVAADTSVEALEVLFAELHVRAAAVVDAEGKPMGIVSETDLLRFRREGSECEEAAPEDLGPAFHVEPIPAATVAEIMTPVVHTLPEDAPVAYAFGLLGGGDLREVPIVTQEGRVVGMLTSTDLLRWAARDLGYVL